MTTNSGVPVTRDELRPVLDLADYCADVLAAIVRDNWHNLVGGNQFARAVVEQIEAKRSAAALAAASGPDAGTGEWMCARCGGSMGTTEESVTRHVTNCRAVYPGIAEVAAFNESVRPAPASAAAPEERDGELSRLLWRFCEQAQPLGRPDLIEIALDAIHAHVEKVKREARAAGERAATGEVVGTARVTPTWKEGLEMCPRLEWLRSRRTGSTEPFTVAIVRRRGKGEGQ